jgi:acetyltransferase-like isoleucine patch superfamily enzyme
MKYFFLISTYCINISRAIFYRIWLNFIKLKFPNLNLGKNVRIQGLPILEIYGPAEIKSNNTFVSLTRYNPVGIAKPCNIYVSQSGHLSIGSGGGYSGVTIVCWEKVEIGDFCGFGGNVSLWDTDFHGIRHNERVDKNAVKTAPIKIGDNVWIGAYSIILKGVSIGSRSVIGAGSVVTKNIPPDEIWAGNPAHFIKKIN